MQPHNPLHRRRQFHPRRKIIITSLATLSISPAILAASPSTHNSIDNSTIVLSRNGNSSGLVSHESKLDNTTIYNPETSFRECGIQDYQKKGIICMGSLGGVHWICPLNDRLFQGPPFNGLLNTTYWGYDFSYGPCFYCPTQKPIYGDNCRTSVENMTKIFDIGEGSATLLEELCVEMCESGLEGEKCSNEEPCLKPSHFCDFSDRNENCEIGVCQQCPSTLDDCYEEGFLTSEPGRRDCTRCQMHCDEIGHSHLTVNGEEIRSDYMHYATQDSLQRASGPIVDCSKLILNGVEECNGVDGKGVEGKVCFIDDFANDALYWKVSTKATANGCIAIIISAANFFQDGYGCGYHSYTNLSIPYVCVSHEDGHRIRGNHIGEYASVQVAITGQACVNYMPFGNLCTEKVVCSENEFCPLDRNVVDSEDVVGWCWPCPLDARGDPDPLVCYFDFDGGGAVRTPEFVENCVHSCDAQLEFRNCKFCPNNLNPIEFGVEHQSEKCSFCPNHDLEHPDRLVPFFGKNVTCWQMQSFYENVDIPKDSQNCALAQNMNFICGCEGVGYAGANTKTRQVALAWTPRVMAILSIMAILVFVVKGSLFIVFDTTKNKQKRNKLLNQILCTISIFDIIGSTAYSLTTLPIPEFYYVYGSRGNEKSCIAQGFFIQIGSIACFLNIPLAVYYSKSIKHGWRDEKLKKNRIWLFAPPIFLGGTISFILIPYYDNMFVWCNNLARYWPEIPIIISIISTTAIMGDICNHVYKQTKATSRYASRSNVCSSVFKQACFFIGAFYFTWVPYLALQYMWSSGKAFSVYGFILYAASTVPMQGVFNFLVYIRPRYLDESVESVSALMRRISICFSRQSTTQMQIDESRGRIINEKI